MRLFCPYVRRDQRDRHSLSRDRHSPSGGFLHPPRRWPAGKQVSLRASTQHCNGSVRAILKQRGRHPRPCRPRFLTESAPFSSNPLSVAMVLTAIPTATRGRLGVFAGVHCRTDSLQVRISGHRPTASDASRVTYKQVLRTARTGWDETPGEEHILSICLALRRSPGRSTVHY